MKLQSSFVPALHLPRIFPVVSLTIVGALLLAGCERSAPSNGELESRNDPARRVVSVIASQEKSSPSARESSVSTEIAPNDTAQGGHSSAETGQPPPRGSKLSAEQVHRLLTGSIQFNPGSIPSSGIPVQEDTPLQIGQELQVKWQSTWWAGTIVGFESDGRPRIHYYGWADSYDEPKDRSALQLDPDARLRALDQIYEREGRRPAPIPSAALHDTARDLEITDVDRKRL